MSKVSKLCEIYMGQIDAKDELNYGTEETFLECFVNPPNFNIEELLTEHKFLINGFKGVGKTALLYYLESECLKRDIQTCRSFLLFKSDFNDIAKGKMDSAAKRLVKSIEFDKESMKSINDFTDIWKIIVFQRIIEDNEDNSSNLFEADENWELFVSHVKSIKILSPTSAYIMKPQRLKILGSIFGDGSVSAGVEIDFDEVLDFKTLSIFSEKVQETTLLFSNLKRTDIPYYIFIDELEAFYADDVTFKRDLTMIRDLILTIKQLNFIMISAKMKNTKIICSVRTEIINSIYRFIPTKELNKAISGFECFLNWNYLNTIAIQHPLFHILLKRMKVTDEKKGVIYDSLEDVYKAWFSQGQQSQVLVNHILTSFWNKPRDVIRLISALKNSPLANSESLHNEVLNQSFKSYSNSSLEEISGELNAIYSANEISIILTWLIGIQSPFSLDDFNSRVKQFSGLKKASENLSVESVISDLYRVGIIGNYNPNLGSGKHRWQHKNDNQVIFDDEWLFVVHNGLNISLSVTNTKGVSNRKRKTSYDKNPKALNIGEVYNTKIMKLYTKYALVDINHSNRNYKAFLHVNKTNKLNIYTIEEAVTVDEWVSTKVLNYDVKHERWIVELVESC